ncbi:MAG: hypothetical protein ACHREM_30520 [Polyangiales bacterium]
MHDHDSQLVYLNGAMTNIGGRNKNNDFETAIQTYNYPTGTGSPARTGS